MAAQTPTASVRPIKNCGQFPDDDSLVFTPKPQATSTVDHRKNKNDSLDKLQDELEALDSGDNKDKVGRLEDNNHDNTKDNANFLVNERDLVGSLKKQLDQAIADIRRNSYAKQSDATSCSSLGILKLDDVEDIAAGRFCDGDDDETSRVLEKLIPTKEDDCEMSWRMTRELARQSISSRKLSLLSNNSFNSFSSSHINDESINKKSTDNNYVLKKDNDIKIAGIEKVENKNTSTSVIQPSREPQSHKLNPFDGERYSTISFSNEEFIPGEKASSLLLQDQISWMKEKADIPVTNDDKSLSGIYPDDRLSHASSYLRQGSGPLGTLDGNTDVISRPNFGNDIFSPVKRNQTIKSSNGNNSSASSCIDENDYQQHLFNQFGNNIKFYNDNTLDEIPTKELANTNNRQTFVKSIHCTESNNDDKNKSVRPNDDRLSVSSVASITHIAELLNDMSMNASPRLIIDKMLSAGSRNSNVASADKKDEKVLKGRKLLDCYDKTKQNLNCIKEDNEDVVKRTSDHFKDSLSKLLEEARKCGNTLQNYDHLKQSDANVSINDDNRLLSSYGDGSISNDGDTDEDGGKENDINNESVWILPSRTSLCEDSKLISINKSTDQKSNDADIFKIPDTKNIISLTKKRKQNTVNKNVILLDTTNTYQLLTNKRDRNTGQFSSKKIPLINAESNETIVDGNIDETITEYYNKKSETDENRTRYSSSNSSNVNEFLARDMLSENDDVICIDDIPNSSSSSMSDLLNHFNDNDVSATNKNKEVFCNIDTPLSGNNRSLVRKLLLKNYNIDDSVVCIGESHFDTINDTSYFNDKDTSLDKINKSNFDVNIAHQCIGTVTKCHVPLENNSRDFVKKHCLSIITVKCDGETVPNFDDIVRLNFPEEVLLKPNDSKNVEVSLVPLVAKSIEVSLKIESMDLLNASNKNLTDITYCIMKVVGVHPQIKVETESLTNSSFDGLNFGLLPEQSIKKSAVKITNEGSVSVPILLEISKLSSDILVFYMMENDEVNDSSDINSKKEVEVLRKLIFIDPGQTIDEYIYCFTPPLSLSGKNRNSTNSLKDGVSSCKMGQVSGQFSVHLVTIEHDVLISVPPQLAKLHLLALVGQTRILIAGNCNPLIIPAYNHKPLIVRNAGVTPVELKIHCDNQLFSITEHQILLEPEQNGIINIEFVPDNTNNSEVSLKGTLWLSVVSSEIRYSVDLHGELRERITGQLCNSQTSKNLTSSSTGSNSTTPQTSRSSSPSSASSYSRTSDLGSLELACTCSALVWASCPLSVLASSNKKSCVLRNKQNHREKLLLTISDPLSCYKIIEEKGSCVTEMRLNLECMESRQITVAFSPTQVGPCKASLIITRVQRKSLGLPTPTQKKVLHLYGYGGKAVLNIKGVFRDPELRMWTYLDSNTLQTSFTLENTGDGTAFVKLGQESVATGVTITPEECLIAAHKSVNVELSFSPTPGRADHLLHETNNLEKDCKTGDMLNITRITITHGDEATRLRLKRLYCHLINDKQQADSLLMEKLTTLNNLFPGTSISEISTLKDKMESIKTLWLEGVRENNVGVLLEKSALENAQLDSTAQFIDLATTIMDDTIYCNKLQQLIVAPRVVTLSRAQPVSSFSLRNTTVLQSIFHVEVPYPSFRLTVEPQHGTLPPHTSCLVTVKHSNVPTSTPSTAVLKIHSDLMDVIEVPVNWSNIIKPLPVKAIVDAIGDNSTNKIGCVYSSDYSVTFPTTLVGGKTVCRVCVRNTSDVTVMVLMENISGPFEMRTLEFPLKGNWYLNFKVYFKPLTPGKHEGILNLSIDKDRLLIYNLHGEAIYR